MTDRWTASFSARETAFEALVGDARRLCDRGADTEAAHAVSIAAEYAWRCPFGAFSSPELEAILGQLAGRLTSGRAIADRSNHEGVLHIATRTLGVGGHTRILRQWLEGDRTRTHDLIVTDQGPRPLPSAISRAVGSSGGTIRDLSGLDLRERARVLRNTAAGHRFCVVHQDPSDVVPSLALAIEPRGWSTILVDHADHVFWLGGGMADIVAHTRPMAVSMASRHRGLSGDGATIIPLPFDLPLAKMNKAAARADLGIRSHEVVILSIASEYKYGQAASAHFLDALEPLLTRFSELRVLVVGPRSRGRWQLAADRFGERVQAVGQQTEIANYLAAADIYIDSYPFPSFTSAMQAAQNGLPTLGRGATHPDLAYLQLDDEAGGSAITWVAGDIGLVKTLAHWIEDPQARGEAGTAAAEAVRRLPRGEDWLRSIEQTYARAAISPAAPAAGQLVAPRIPIRLAEAVADAHHYGRIDGAFFHALVRSDSGGHTTTRGVRTARTLWRVRADHLSQRALADLWRDRARAGMTRLGLPRL